jgi:N-acetylmuramoyl-L-alanine amidase
MKSQACHQLTDIKRLKMLKSIKTLPFVISLLFGAVHANALTVALDPGHTPSSPGATAACGKREVGYNDIVTGLLKEELERTGHTVILTRQFGQEVIQADQGNGTGRESARSLRQRVANAGRADILLSVHHDSVSERYLESVPNLCGTTPGTRFTASFKTDPRVQIGYNVFASNSKQSRRLALAIGHSLKEAGLVPSSYHAAPWELDQVSLPVDVTNGVWIKNLFIIRESPMPAVLIEVYPIVDPEYEQKASTPEFRKLVINAIRKGIDAYAKN